MFCHSITEFVFFNGYPREAKRSAIFTQERSQEEKARFPLCMCRILFAGKHRWTALRMSRPLFASSYCRSRGRLSANEKKEKFASNDKVHYGKCGSGVKLHLRGLLSTQEARLGHRLVRLLRFFGAEQPPACVL